MPETPALQLPTDIREGLAKHGPEVVTEVEAFLERAPRRCMAITSERVAAAPERQGFLARILGRPTAAPNLDVLTSKFGGRPYRERGDGYSFDGVRFICQINLAEVPEVEGAPREGLLALDVSWVGGGGYRLRWYAHPTQAAADEDGEVPMSLGKWETQMRFTPAWSLPGGDAWRAPLPDDQNLRDLWDEWNPTGFVDPERLHILFGHRSAGLDDHYGIAAPPTASDEITDYEQVFRLTYDNQADFGIGTNWYHVMAPAEDYARGELSRAIVVGANY